MKAPNQISVWCGEVGRTKKTRRSTLKIKHTFIGAAAVVAVGCGQGEESPRVDAIQQAVQPITIDTRRSLAVTEQTILARFSLERVMSQLASQSGVPGATALSLFQQWWDTQNPGTGAPNSPPHCDDQVDPTLGTVINGYPYLCRAGAEGAQSTCDPFAPNSTCAYIPIGLFNRFDQAPASGAHCGEYRVIYAKQSGIQTTSDRNLLIFEAALPNPQPQLGIMGCQQIVDTWATLSKQPNITVRANTLENFYFNGQGQGQGLVPPVISITNFGDNALGAGQIRTNQFSNTTTGWSLREFKLLRTCAGGSCSAVNFVPVTNKDNAYGPLFAPSSTLPTAAGFRAFFPTQVASLAASSVPAIDITTPDIYNTAQSQASGATAAEMKYADQLTTAPSALRSDIQAALTAIGSSLTPDDIAKRAMAQSCAGCHRLNNNVDIGGGLTWPASLGFTHVTERETETVDGEVRFKISDTLINALLPARKALMEDFLNNRPLPPRAPNHPLSGSTTHG
jgi:hypothetical protein